MAVGFGVLLPVSQFGVYAGIIMLGRGILSIVFESIRLHHCQYFFWNADSQLKAEDGRSSVQR